MKFPLNHSLSSLSSLTMLTLLSRPLGGFDEFMGWGGFGSFSDCLGFSDWLKGARPELKPPIDLPGKQWRFPRTKKRRIRRKWAKNQANRR